MKISELATDITLSRVFMLRWAAEPLEYAAKAFALRTKPNAQGAHWASNIYEQWVKSAAGTIA